MPAIRPNNAGSIEKRFNVLLQTTQIVEIIIFKDLDIPYYAPAL